MSTEFTYKVLEIRCANENDLTDVVKQVNINVTGTNGDVVFTLNQNLELGAADPSNFVDFANLTEEQVVSWLTADPNTLDSLHRHIEFVINKELEKNALTNKALPWLSEG